MKKSQWNILKNFINSTEIGKTISRKQMLNVIFSQTKSGGSQRYGTVDVYRRCLVMIRVLEIVNRGIYKVNHHIKESSSISGIKKAANSNGYREWFHDFIK